MSATRIPQQVEGFDTLRELLDIMKNPEQLTKASEIARKEMALTEAENTKVTEARELLKNHLKIKADLQAERDQLDADKSAHASRVAIEMEKLKQDRNDNESVRNILADKEKAQKDTDAKHAEERKQLDLQSAATKKVASDVESQLSRRESILREKEEKLSQRETMLAAQKRTLDEKAAKFKALISD